MCDNMNIGLINNSKNTDDYYNNNIKQEEEEPVIIKKKKGRKSKKDKLLELEKEAKKKEIVEVKKTIHDKIFDIIVISNKEYYYDGEFNVLLDENVSVVGFKQLDKFILYEEQNKIINETNDKINMLFSKYNKFSKNIKK